MNVCLVRFRLFLELVKENYISISDYKGIVTTRLLLVYFVQNALIKKCQ